MTSFAAFKRRLEVGTLVHYEHLTSPALSGNRVLSRVQTNAIAGFVTRADGETVESWCYWPKADSVICEGPDTVTLLDPDTREPWLRLTVVS